MFVARLLLFIETETQHTFEAIKTQHSLNEIDSDVAIFHGHRTVHRSTFFHLSSEHHNDCVLQTDVQKRSHAIAHQFQRFFILGIDFICFH